MDNPKEVEKKISNKRDSKSLDNLATSPPVPNIKPKAEQILEIKTSEEEVKSSKPEKEKPKNQASAETLSTISDNIFTMQDISQFISNPAITNDKRGQYCIQLNIAVMGEAARQVLRLLEMKEEHMPRACKEMPWDKLIYLRTACSHKFHLQNLEQLTGAIKVEIPALEKIAAKIIALIEKNQHEKKEHEQEPLKLAAIDTYLNLINEIEKKKKAEKSKDESRKDNHIDKLTKQVKGLKIIIDELNNIRNFLKSGNDNVTLYAVQMAMLNMGLVVSDRLDKEFQEKHPLQINIPGSNPFTWKNLISIRETTIHQNYKMNAERTTKESLALQGAFYFFQGLYEQQSASLMKLKTEFHQKQQAAKPSSSQPTALAEVREPFKMSFTLPKAQPKMKVAGFVIPLASPVQPVSAKIPPKQSTSSDVQEGNESPKPGKKM